MLLPLQSYIFSRLYVTKSFLFIKFLDQSQKLKNEKNKDEEVELFFKPELNVKNDL